MSGTRSDLSIVYPVSNLNIHINKLVLSFEITVRFQTPQNFVLIELRFERATGL